MVLGVGVVLKTCVSNALMGGQKGGHDRHMRGLFGLVQLGAYLGFDDTHQTSLVRIGASCNCDSHRNSHVCICRSMAVLAIMFHHSHSYGASSSLFTKLSTSSTIDANQHVYCRDSRFRNSTCHPFTSRLPCSSTIFTFQVRTHTPMIPVHGDY